MRPTLLLALAALAPAQDLGREYRATLVFEEGASGHTWETGPEHVWALDNFELDLGPRLHLDLGPSDVVLGVSGSNVLWATVVPRGKALLRSSLAGQGERVRSVWLRFHPARTGRLFPRPYVAGRGPGPLAAEGLRVAGWKLGASWQSGGLPRVPWRRALVADVDTDVARRFFLADLDAGAVDYEAAHEPRRLPLPTPLDSEEALAAFDEAWTAFDEHYPYFDLKDVDWPALRQAWRPVAARATTRFQAAAAIGGLLEPLDDPHVWVRTGEAHVPLVRRQRPLNASRPGTLAALAAAHASEQDLTWGRTADGIGYLAVDALSDPGLPAAVDGALAALADCWALVLDLRHNGGGSEELARGVAGRFLTERVEYGHVRFRGGPGHDTFGPSLARRCPPRGPWTFQGPVVTLVGGRTMSSAEALALILLQVPGGVTLGERTAGSSSNPMRLELAGGIEVSLPRWRALDPSGATFEQVGLAPTVGAAFPPDAFRDDRDPVMQAALARLRETPEEARSPGRRER